MIRNVSLEYRVIDVYRNYEFVYTYYCLISVVFFSGKRVGCYFYLLFYCLEFC